MKRRLNTMTIAVAAGLAIGSLRTAVAQERGYPQALLEVRPASLLMHADVRNKANESIATTEDLVMDHAGRLQYLIVGTGGALGVGKTMHAVPAKATAFGYRDGKWFVTIDMSKEQIEKAPVLKSSTYEELGEANWHQANQKYFNDTSQTQAQRPDQTLRAYEMVRGTLFGPGAQKVATIEDVILDQNNQAAFLVIGVDKVLGLGGETTVAPLNVFQFQHTPSDLKLKVSIAMTAEQLAKAPRIKSGDYLPLKDQKFVDTVNKFYEGAAPRR